MKSSGEVAKMRKKHQQIENRYVPIALEYFMYLTYVGGLVSYRHLPLLQSVELNVPDKIKHCETPMCTSLQCRAQNISMPTLYTLPVPVMLANCDLALNVPVSRICG
jgi:hypothetical protein